MVWAHRSRCRRFFRLKPPTALFRSGLDPLPGSTSTWEQNPTQYHIVNALADLPVLEYLPAVMTKGSTNMAVEGKPVRELK